MANVLKEFTASLKTVIKRAQDKREPAREQYKKTVLELYGVLCDLAEAVESLQKEGDSNGKTE